MKLSIVIFSSILCLISACQPKKDYVSMAKYFYTNYNAKAINIDSVDNYNDLIKDNKPSGIYGIQYDLDKLELSNDTGNYNLIIPFFEFRNTDPACRERPSLKVKLSDSNFIANDLIFEYHKLSKFDSFIRNYCDDAFKHRIELFNTKWNNVIISDSISFKTKLFPVLNTMYKAYLEKCMQNPNYKFSRGRFGQIKDFYTEVTPYDFDIPIKSTIIFTPPKIVE